MLVGAQPAQAMVLLGDVRQVEEEAEGAQHERLLAQVERADRGRQLGAGRGVAVPAGAGEQPDPLLDCEQLLALLLDDHLAEQLPEQPHVRAERIVRPRGSRGCVTERVLSRSRDGAEQAVHAELGRPEPGVRPGREEQRVLRPRGPAVPERDPPHAVQDERACRPASASAPA